MPRTIIERLGFMDNDRCKSIHDEIQIWVYNNFKFIVKEACPNWNIADTSFSLEFEYVVTDRNFVVGFIDLYCPQLGIAIEVKSEIPTLGELIRQIHFYNKYLNVAKWIVVSPDSRVSKILKDQGICFIRYQSSQLKLFKD